MLIETKNLYKQYGEVRALEDLSLTLEAGEIIGLLGPNGAGKTTAIHILLGLLSPSSGTVQVFGMSPTRHHHDVSKRFNFSSAYVQLPSNLRVSENLTIFSRLYNVPNRRQKISGLLKTFGIDHLENRITGALSSGEKTRLNLVKALLNDPELLLLDEPTASLDPEMADTVRTTLKNIQEKTRMGILYTSHNMPEVESLCDRILFIHEGKTVARGTPDEVKAKFSSQNLDEVFIKIVRKGDLVL